MKAIKITLKTEQPVLVTSFQGDPNSDVSYSYIPGSALRGALIGRYMRQNGIRELDPTNPEVQRLFFDADKTCYLNAYLFSQNDKRTLPVPRSWFRDKDDEFNDKRNSIPVYDFSLRESDEDEEDEDEEDEDIAPESPKAVGDYFWVKSVTKKILYKEKRRINIHNKRNRKKGKATKEEGEIFRYEALDAGQTFQAIVIYQDSDKAHFEKLLNIEKLKEEEEEKEKEKPDLWLGGSQSAGYGRVKIKNIEFDDSWHEIDTKPEEREGDNLIVTLLSDAIIRDDISGQVIADSNLVKQEIDRILDRENKLPLPHRVYATSALIGGFNRKWGLPLPQVPALAAGSVFVFENVKIAASKIEELEEKGIGERRVDGFGRIAINWAVKWDNSQELTVELPEDEALSSQPSLKYESSLSLAEKMAERILRQKLEKLLLDSLSREKINKLDSISNSQLSRLRLVARQCLDSSPVSPQLLESLLEKLPSKAKEQYKSTKLDEKIRGLLNREKDWIGTKIKPVTVADKTVKLNDELRLEYTLRLIMAIAKKAVKEKQEKQEKND